MGKERSSASVRPPANGSAQGIGTSRNRSRTWRLASEPGYELLLVIKLLHFHFQIPSITTPWMQGRIRHLPMGKCRKWRLLGLLLALRMSRSCQGRRRLPMPPQGLRLPTPPHGLRLPMPMPLLPISWTSTRPKCRPANESNGPLASDPGTASKDLDPPTIGPGHSRPCQALQGPGDRGVSTKNQWRWLR